VKTYDQGSSLFWLVFSICVLVESLRLKIGTLHDPGMGFMSFGASGLLGILSIILLIQTFFKKEETKIAPLFLGTLWGRVFLVIIALLIYSRLMPIAGYLISTFLLMSFLYWIVKGQKWWWVLVSSFLTTTISYYIFSKWLNCQFPEGFFGL
jgi:putative tricarboxylic transport membrane protein